eukprot:m.213504 g.213504  ORF g.213504 m.213504 type:complete len:221 (-) comp26641_c0_seq1:9-671(-)
MPLPCTTTVYNGRHIQWAANAWHPAVVMPAVYTVLDMTDDGWEPQSTDGSWCVGRYDEKRRGVYTTPLFGGVRDVHVGLDIGGPIGTPVLSIANGVLHSVGYNPSPGDYGHVMVVEYTVPSSTSIGTEEPTTATPFWMLYGHLSAASVAGKTAGQHVVAGETLGWFGDRKDNGGWPPHVHLQLAMEAPETHDMPGVVTSEDREAALITYPDPRLVLGPLY